MYYIHVNTNPQTPNQECVESKIISLNHATEKGEDKEPSSRLAVHASPVDQPQKQTKQSLFNKLISFFIEICYKLISKQVKTDLIGFLF